MVLLKENAEVLLHSPSYWSYRLLAGVGDVLLLVLPGIVEHQRAARGVGDDSWNREGFNTEFIMCLFQRFSVLQFCHKEPICGNKTETHCDNVCIEDSYYWNSSKSVQTIALFHIIIRDKGFETCFCPLSPWYRVIILHWTRSIPPCDKSDKMTR